MENNKKEYYIGLDIGTNSVGWAVTDKEYNILKFKGKNLLGVNLFDEANTAQERRFYRAARRNLQRRKERQRLLREIFIEEISKIDPDFFLRLDESDLYLEDKTIKSKYSIFNDKNLTDKEYYKKYPTIYHLIMDLIESDEKKDIRLVYLACNWIIKNRGHFLFDGDKFDTNESLNTSLDELIHCLNNEPYNLELKINIADISKTLINKSIKTKEKQIELTKHFGNSKLEKGVITLLSGGSQNLSNMFDDENLKNAIIKKIDFKDFDIDSSRQDCLDILGERFKLIETIKKVYDVSLLSTIMSATKKSPDDKRYISSSKVALYDKYAHDLKLLKKIIKYYSLEEYNKFFKNNNIDNNFVAFSKTTMTSNKKEHTSQRKDFDLNDFYKYINKLLDKALINADKKDKELNKSIEYIKKEIENKTFLSKQKGNNNTLIPYQLREIELRKILDNQSKFYTFLTKKEDGWTISEKIISLLTFKIPYYVGPLNNAHSNSVTSWVVRKEKGKVTPWNFDEMIDVDESRKIFINSKLNICTYLKDEKVLPKNSLLYKEFIVLNELNNLKVNGSLIDNDLKKDIFEDLFKKYKKISNKKIIEYIKKKRDIKEDVVVSGIDGDFTQNLCSYIDIKNIIGDKIDEAKYRDIIENIIRDITLYGDDKKYISEKFEKEYKTVFSSTELDRLKSLRLSDWGRLSKKFLNEIKITNLYTGEIDTIIGFMRNYPYNLSELNSKKFNFSKVIDEYNEKFNINDSSLYSILDKLYLSSPAKRMVWQTLSIVKEIKKIMKGSPKKIFVEMARGADGTKRNKSRKYFLEELYKKNKKEIIEFFNNDTNKYNSLLNDLQSENESNLKNKKLYLYYIQLGKCMYSLENINKGDINNISLYDKDHIYPKSKLFDDSLENLVLVKKEINSEIKKDKYPLDDTVINPNIKANINKYWKLLHNCGFIGNKKYERLIRNTPFAKDELGGFIERQMVETRQASKEVANLLNKICNNSEIVYVKAESVSRFRNMFDIVKSRLVNDYHHAHDAYLNIVVGNVYNVKFTKDPRYFINNNKTFNYNLDKIFDYDVFRNNENAWVAKNEKKVGSINTVYKNLNIKDIQITKRVYDGKGKLFDVTIMHKTKGQTPQKENSKKSDIDKYGGVQ